MTFENLRLAACLSLLGGLSACSSTKTTAASKDGGVGVFVNEDASSPVGSPCGSDQDCDTPSTCSSDSFSIGPYFPTPVCVATCTPSPDPNSILVCGDDLGICQANSTTSGTCFPVCFVTPDGSISNCLANDDCQIIGATADPNVAGQTDLFGECQPGCSADSQCPASSSCDTTYGICETTVTPPSLAFGAACNPSSTADPPPCACVGPSGGTTGFCSAYCTTGNACPQPGQLEDGGTSDAGVSAVFVCSAQLGTLTTIDAGISFATQPIGLQGLCFPQCNADADCAFLGSGASCMPDPGGAPAKGICVTQ